MILKREQAMQRFGSNSDDMRNMNPDDTFLGRVKLLVVMLKTFLVITPWKGIGRKRFLNNAEAVHKVCGNWNRYILQIRSTPEEKKDSSSIIFSIKESVCWRLWPNPSSPETPWGIIANASSEPI